MSGVDPKDIREGSFLKQSLDFQMDGNRRIALAVLATERERFAIKDPDPVIIPIPFFVMKEAVAQILRYEAEVALGKVGLAYDKDPAAKFPAGVQGVLKMSELLMDAAQMEAAGEALTDEARAPEFKPNLKAILGGD